MQRKWAVCSFAGNQQRNKPNVNLKWKIWEGKKWLVGWCFWCCCWWWCWMFIVVMGCCCWLFFSVFVFVLFCYCHFCWCWYCSCFCCINSCSCRLFYIFDIDDAVVNAVAIIGGYGAWTMIITKQFMSSAGLCCHFLWWMHIIYFLSNRYLLSFCVCVYAFKYTWRMLELSKSVTHPMLIIAAFAYYVVHCQSLMF